MHRFAPLYGAAREKAALYDALVTNAAQIVVLRSDVRAKPPGAGSRPPINLPPS
jgi:hypothetical protein